MEVAGEVLSPRTRVVSAAYALNASGTGGQSFLKQQGTLVLSRFTNTDDNELDVVDVHFEQNELTKFSIVQVVMTGHNSSNKKMLAQFVYSDVTTPSESVRFGFGSFTPGHDVAYMAAVLSQSLADPTTSGMICGASTDTSQDLACSGTGETNVFTSDWTLGIGLTYAGDDADKDTEYTYYVRVTR